ncbi:MAG: FHA domain-containing protein [Synechococcaceae cyanobacterium SM2_3_2]|nr:FHA domain-containing protein [Synechococcaceae cyanobacterium SM2_3_2]
MQIQLSWDDPITLEPQQALLTPPVGLGRWLEQIPEQHDGQAMAKLLVIGDSISRFHCLIVEQQGQIWLEDRSANGTLVNGQKVKQDRIRLQEEAVIGLGSHTLTIRLLPDPSTATVIDGSTLAPIHLDPLPKGTQILSQLGGLDPRSSTILPPPQSLGPQSLGPQPLAPPPQAPLLSSFPPPRLFAQQQISLEALYQTGLPVQESDYLALGGGIGSFIWVDTLRIYGVSQDQIRVLSINQKPYERYEKLLTNCQIPRWKRIRSGSDSTPDNLWGWPGYALRDSWRSLTQAKLREAGSFLWQVFSEPLLAETYTPRAGDVFESMDREVARIGWDQMLIYGNIRAIRKTTDGRYGVAYSATRPGQPPDYRFWVARHLHLAIGYPAIKLLDDLQDFRQRSGNLTAVVHGYETHDHIYDHLEQHGGTVVIRGFGIVASQVMDRLNRARQKHPKIDIVHLTRSAKPGNRYGLAKRKVSNHWEFQPYNWPKACWGGSLRAKLEAASPQKRKELLSIWGGTTTANRQAWREIVERGIQEGWYSTMFGTVERVELDEVGRPITFIQGKIGSSQLKVTADFVIDCTGLISDPNAHPLLKDLIEHYSLPLNSLGRLDVTNDFELARMRNDSGRIYVSGIVTLGGPYAAADSFLGLQYTAHRSVEHLADVDAPGLKPLYGIRSLQQWLKWATNQSP